MLKQIRIIKKYAALLHKSISQRKPVYMHEENGIYYLSRYVRKDKLSKVSLSKQNFIKCYYRYKNCEPAAMRRINELYLSFVEDFVVKHELLGDILITCIPRTSGGANALKDTVRKVSAYADIEGCNIENGLWVLQRKKRLAPIHQGNRYSKHELKDSMQVVNLPQCDAVIILDDIVKTGNTFWAAKELLLEAGIEKVYCLCLFKV